MNAIFDYVYYRINKAYFKWDGRNGATSIITVSMVQSMVLGDIIALTLKEILTKEELNSKAKLIAYTWAVIFIVLLVLNLFKYKNRYNALKRKWKDESELIRTVRGFGVFFIVLFPWLVLYLFVLE
jgi:hypothetical protein